MHFSPSFQQKLMLKGRWEESMLTINTDHMNTRLITYLLFLLLPFAGISCGKKNQQGGRGQMPPVPVTPYVVQEKQVAYYDVYPARVTALEDILLKSEVSGYVTGIFFKEGSHVKKGKRLYEIDKRKYQASYDQAQASVEIARANLNKAQRDYDRYQELAQRNAIARQTVEDSKTNLENAKTQLKAAKAELSRSQTDLQYAMVDAPFSGVIGFSEVKKGAYVVAGQTVLNGLSSDDPVGVDIQADAAMLPYFRELEKKGGKLPDSTFLLEMDDGSAYPQTGQLGSIDRSVDPNTGTIRVRLIFPNHESLLKTGMTARAKVLNRQSGSQLVVPTKAIQEQMSEYFVYRIGKDTVKQVRVTPGINLGMNTVVLSGISAGDTIVAEGLKRINDGSKVRIVTGNNEGRKNMKKD